jgi:hypothetical protein
MGPDFESFSEFGFVEQDIDDDIKLRMLFAELNRLETTIEIHGSPYIFVDDEAVRFSPEAGKERFFGHREWLKDLVCQDSMAVQNLEGRLDRLRAILSRISHKEIHPYILLILAQIVVVTGISSFCNGA